MARTRRTLLLTLSATVLAAAMVGAGAWAAVSTTGGIDEWPGLPAGSSPWPSASPSPTPTPSQPAEPARAGIVDVHGGRIHAEFLGDSLTYGLYATTEADGYRPRVIASLREAAVVESIRWGDSGFTTQMVADEADVSPDADLVVIALGTNDIWRTGAERFAVDYAALVADVDATAPAATLLCLGVWADRGTAAPFDRSIADECRAAGGVFVPLSDIYDAPGTRGPAGVTGFAGVSDVMHPNDAGFAAIAARVIRALGL